LRIGRLLKGPRVLSANIDSLLRTRDWPISLGHLPAVPDCSAVPFDATAVGPADECLPAEMEHSSEHNPYLGQLG
jgi:hypothetical protein